MIVKKKDNTIYAIDGNNHPPRVHLHEQGTGGPSFEPYLNLYSTATDNLLYDLIYIALHPKPAPNYPKTGFGELWTSYTRQLKALDSSEVIFLLTINALFSLLFLGIVLYFNFKAIEAPMRSLTRWAQSLSRDQMPSRPNFLYAELNNFAALMYFQTIKMRQANKKEKKFLSYLSHELNNILSIISGNSDIINYILAGDNSEERTQEVLLNAFHDLKKSSDMMRDIVQGILWLERDLKQLQPKKFELKKLILEVIALQQATIHQSANIRLELDLEPLTIKTYYPPVKIIVSNLIRNTLTHSAPGVVTISLRENHLILSNPLNAKAAVQNENNFGIGLELTKRILDKLGIAYQIQEPNNAFQITIDFSPLVLTSEEE